MTKVEFKHENVAEAIQQLIHAFQKQVKGEIISVKSITFNLAGEEPEKQADEKAALKLSAANVVGGPVSEIRAEDQVCTQISPGVWQCI